MIYNVYLSVFLSDWTLNSGTVSWSCFDLFGGCLCIRKAWEMMAAASLELWGVKTRITFDFNAPCCQLLLGLVL